MRKFYTQEELQDILENSELFSKFMHELYLDTDIKISMQIKDNITGHEWQCSFKDIETAVIYLKQYEEARKSYV